MAISLLTPATSAKMERTRQKNRSAVSQTYSGKTPIQLHPLQQRISNSQAKYTLAVSGRRFGKTVLQIFKALKRVEMGAPYNPVSPPVVVLVEPTLVMARRLLWKQLQNLLLTDSETFAKSEFLLPFPPAVMKDYEDLFMKIKKS